MNQTQKYILLVLSICLMAYLTFTIYQIGFEFFIIATINSMVLLYLILKQFLSTKCKPFSSSCNHLSISVVIPFCNETKQNLINGLKSLLSQSYPIKEIFYIDDGSHDISAFTTLQLFVQGNQKQQDKIGEQQLPDIYFHRFKTNTGKRNAQVWAFKQIKSDIIVTMDSDTILQHIAIKELLKPFNDPEIMAATGSVRANNQRDNLMTRLIHSRYVNAFEVERAYQSYFGNLLCCSGPFSAYRSEVIIKNIDNYSEQSFLGKNVQFGDDRCLTTYANKLGKTCYQSTAIANTTVPRRIPHFLKQQVRWNKSYFRESFNTIQKIRKFPVIIITLMELIVNLIFPPLLLFLILFYLRDLTALTLLLIHYLVMVTINANIWKIINHKKMSLFYLLTPLYNMIHLICLFPIRLLSLMTITATTWGTR